ncbi:MAG: DNA endonuclease SmrA [Gammaproteobacteria bacterium]|jgi:DNA-nicking Smr family endonuclease
MFEMDEMDEDDLFKEAMEGVEPLRSEPRNPERRARRSTPGELERRRAAEEHRRERLETNFLTLGKVPQVGPYDLLEWKKDGVQDGVYRKLRLGKYEVEARLDLHRKTVKEARVEMFRFLQTCLDLGLRTLLISHGKGEKSNTPGRLKSYVGQWLMQVPQVIAFHSAQPRHGGYGAVYALLQKSEEQRVETREKHGLKGIRS